ncbi:hypothetical protein GQR58_010523 [Nymphon striatum]|nr:hypothetical protein GQR58_010523 [Nymphon striatum]
MLAISPAYAINGDDVISLVDQHENGYVDLKASIEMVLTDQRGKKTVRLMDFSSIEADKIGEKRKFVFQNPSDVKGTSILINSKVVKDDEQWIYLPAFKRIKRISSKNKKSAFMGSQFSYEDLASQEKEKYKNILIKEATVNNIPCYVVQRSPIHPNSGYHHIDVYVDKKRHRLVKTEYFDKQASAIIDNSVGVWFDLNDPEISVYDTYNNSFGEKEWSILLLKTKSIYDPAFLRQLDKATEEIESLKNVFKVTSITNVRDNWKNTDDELDYRRLYSSELIQSGDLQAIDKFKQQLASNPIFDRNIINKNKEQYSAVLIQNDNFLRDQSRYRIDLVDGIEYIVQQLDSIEDWGLAGTTVVNAELNKAAQRDVIVFYLLVSLLLTLICWFILRSVKDLCVVLSVVVSSVVMAMGSLALFDIPYNMATVMLPPMLIALPVAGVLHIITDFHISHETQLAENALIETFDSIWIPAFWAGATTIAGLASFGLSDISPFYQFGLVGGFGMLIALIMNMSIAPLLMYIFWHREKKDTKTKSSFTITSDSKKILRHPYLIGLISVIIISLLFGLKNTEVDTDYSKFFDKGTRITHSYDLLKEAGMGQNPIIVHLKYPPNKQFIDPEYFKKTLGFEKELNNLAEVVNVLSPSDLIRELDLAYNGSSLPAETDKRLANYSRQQLSQLFLLAELSGNDDIDDLILKSRDELQLVVMTPYLSSKKLHAFRQHISAIQKKHLPKDVQVSITGTTVLWANMDTQITQTQIYTLVFVGLFLIILLPLLFHSVWLGALGLLINFLPLAATLGLMSWLDIKINMATVIIGAISVGVVVDDTLHMFYRIQRNRSKGQVWTTAVENSLATIGTSIFRTTVILISSVYQYGNF